MLMNGGSARMIELAHVPLAFAGGKRAELMWMISDQLARNAVSPPMWTWCVNDGELTRSCIGCSSPAGRQSGSGRGACLFGEPDACAQMLLALTSPNDQEVDRAGLFAPPPIANERASLAYVGDSA
jgi:hypothetical protein